MPPMPVEVVDVRTATVRDGFTALGTMDAERNVEIVSEVAGTVKSLPFREGARVKRGALLAVLEDSEQRAEAERTAALAEQQRLAASRTDKLYAGKLVPAEEQERALAARKVAEASHELARARLEKMHIRAPFAGVVGWRRVSPGAYVRAGDVITDLAQSDRMRVSFAAPERFAGALRPGARVTLTTTAHPGEVFEGKIGIVDPQVDRETRTFDLIALLPNRDGRLKAGMSATVTATLEERAHALVVPDEAVIVEGNETFVYVVSPDSTVRRTVVALGLRDSSRVEVRSGLAAGERVVKAGHQKIFPGAKVMPVPEGGAGGPGAAAGAAGPQPPAPKPGTPGAAPARPSAPAPKSDQK